MKSLLVINQYTDSLLLNVQYVLESHSTLIELYQTFNFSITFISRNLWFFLWIHLNSQFGSNWPQFVKYKISNFLGQYWKMLQYVESLFRFNAKKFWLEFDIVEIFTCFWSQNMWWVMFNAKCPTKIIIFNFYKIFN